MTTTALGVHTQSDIMLITPPQLYWNRVFHPTDFSEASQVAFGHALKLAAGEQGRLTILHTDDERHNHHWQEFPRVRQTLERWQLLPANSPKEAIRELGLTVEKISSAGGDAEGAILHYLKKHPHDLIVLATHQYEGLARFTHKTMAESIARRSGEMTLFIPAVSEGFIAINDGSVRVKNIVIPIDRTPNPQIALEAAASIAQNLDCKQVTFTLLHVGHSAHLPFVRTYPQEGWHWQTVVQDGSVQETILATADELDADLIVMATEGHHGFLDALRGSTTERVVRHSICPVLAVPAITASDDSLNEVPVWSSIS